MRCVRLLKKVANDSGSKARGSNNDPAMNAVAFQPRITLNSWLNAVQWIADKTKDKRSRFERWISVSRGHDSVNEGALSEKSGIDTTFNLSFMASNELLPSKIIVMIGISSITEVILIENWKGFA